MGSLLRTALWQQFGATIDMLENALVACSAPLWTKSLWHNPPDSGFLPEFSEFWHITYHTLFWLDLYLSGRPEEEFTPPAPFIWTEIDPPVSPEQPYTREELHVYLVNLRQKCQITIAELTDEQAQRQVDYPWAEGRPVSFLELLLYTMRHVQEHAAQLNLFLGQHDIEGTSDWVGQAQADESGE